MLSSAELIDATIQDEMTSFLLDKASAQYMDNHAVEFLLFDCAGNPIITESKMLMVCEQMGMTKDEKRTVNELSVTYTLPEGYYYLLMPDKKLLRVLEVNKRNIFKKI